MIKIGDCLKIKTKTKDDVFGEVIWEVADVGSTLYRNEPGIKLVMLRGSGPSARKGYTIIDKLAEVEAKIADGSIKVISKQQAETIVVDTTGVNNTQSMPRHGGKGCMEINY